VIAKTFQSLAEAVHTTFPDPSNVLKIHFNGNNFPPRAGPVDYLAVRACKYGLADRQASGGIASAPIQVRVLTISGNHMS